MADCELKRLERPDACREGHPEVSGSRYPPPNNKSSLVFRAS